MELFQLVKKIILAGFLFLAVSFPVHAGLPPNELLDEGTSQGVGVSQFDCVGSGISCTKTGRKATLTVSSAGGAPAGAQYVTLATDATLTDERVLTGTANQITVTDGGAGSTVTLSTPQNIHTGASPTFAGLTLSSFTEGSVLFAGASGVLSQDNANLFWNDTSNRLGIGTTSPDQTLHVMNDSADTGIKLEGDAQKRLTIVTHSDTAASSSGVVFDRTRGTDTSPTAVVNGDRVGHFFYRGWDGAAYQNAAGFTADVDGTVSSGVVPMGFSVLTGSALASRKVRWSVNSSGDFTIGDGTVATTTETWSLSGATDPVWTVGDNSMDLTTGVLKQGGSAVLTSAAIDTYAELNTIVADVTLTHNGLIDTYSEINAIVADVTLTHNGLIDTFAELDAIVADKALVNKADGAVWLGVHDFGGASSVEIPNGTSGTTDATGELFFDTNGDGGTNFSGPVIQIFDGSANKFLFPIPLPLAASEDNFIMKYDATAKTVQWEADTGGAGSPGGADTQVQFNDAGAFGGDAGFTYNKTNDTVTLTGAADSQRLILKGHSTQGTTVFEVQEDGGVPVFKIEAPNALSGVENHISGDGAGDSITTGTKNTAYGWNALTAMTTNSQSVGVGHNAGATITGGQNVCIGDDACPSAMSGIRNQCIGSTSCFTVTTGSSNIGIGINSGISCNGDDNIWLGNTAGNCSSTGFNHSLAIGQGAANTASNQAVIGSATASKNYSEFYLGSGVTKASPAAVTINATGGSGTDNAAGAFNIAGGKATGNAAGGVINFQTSTAGASGTTLQTLATRFTVGTGGVSMPDGALMDLSAINASVTTEGLKLPQATSTTSSTAEGLIAWDTDDDYLTVGTGSGVKIINAKPNKTFFWTADSIPALSKTDAIPPLTKTTGTNVEVFSLSFDAATDECREVKFRVPSDVQSGSTITFTYIWYSLTATTGNVIWDVRYQSTGEDNETWDAALTTKTGSAAAVKGTVKLRTFTTITETLATLGWAGGDIIKVKLCRDGDHVSDTMSGDAELGGFGITIPRA